MTDWIRDLRSREERERDKKLIETQARMEKKQRINDSVPRWWGQFETRIGSLLEELKAAFPDEPGRHFAIERTGERAFRVRAEAPPEQLIEIRFAESYPAVVVEHFFPHATTGRPMSISKKDGVFDIAENDTALSVRYDGSGYASPQSLADQIVREIIGA